MMVKEKSRQSLESNTDKENKKNGGVDEVDKEKQIDKEKDTETKDTKDTETKDTETKDTKDTETKDTDTKDTDTKDTETKDTETKDTETKRQRKQLVMIQKKQMKRIRQMVVM